MPTIRQLIATGLMAGFGLGLALDAGAHGGERHFRHRPGPAVYGGYHYGYPPPPRFNHYHRSPPVVYQPAPYYYAPPPRYVYAPPPPPPAVVIGLPPLVIPLR